MNFSQSRQLQRQMHDMVPGGCHTYAKGDDQFPYLAPGFIAEGSGCHIWDVDGNEYIEYGMGCRAVTLGHAFPAVVEAVQQELSKGSNFSRPSIREFECAEEFLGMIDGADMVKFSKEGSTATTAAIKLARAHTGRDIIAYCQDHPFFAIHDWFIGTTAMSAGIPDAIQELSVSFRYNDLASIRDLFNRYPKRIACVILEPAKYEDPEDHFLHRVQELCREHGAVFILDEMITGFRWDNGGAQKYYDIVPDLSAFGKALANGFSLSALAGKRELMELGGILHEKERVFLMSTTHGAETHALAAGIATMQTYRNEPVVETLSRQGKRLADGFRTAIAKHGLEDYVGVSGKPCCLVYYTLDQQQRPSQAFRALFMQETIRRGVLGTSFIVSYAHRDEDIDETIVALDEVLGVYKKALQEGVEHYLIGRPTQGVYRKYNQFSLEEECPSTCYPTTIR